MILCTSATHPMEIVEVPVPGAAGHIGVTFCPGRKDRDPVSGGWNRDMAADLQAIRRWGANAIISLLTPRETRVLGVERLAHEAGLHGIDLFRCPIFDQHPPDEEFEKTWALAGPEVRHRLRCGERVLVHCRAGRGRSGMIAARLLVELGTLADDATRLVRAARPGALLNPQQVQHVLSIRPVSNGRIPHGK
ncbi:phosphatase [Azospirillum humicireducens]|uniref:protein-tyrosine-phosphatase n=1 Tax=Azospirillum humicireducens TaxID=1226968 RepID=A0A2R4VPH7_9PROT|nr:dual specificity protein phosphatase family protein [Azospirillum humicireducens]AWB06347.1 phosphatase [Azospirillum humicireducens]